MNVRSLLILFLPALALACSLTASPVTGDQAGAMQPVREPVQINLEGAAQSAPSQASPFPTGTPVTCTVTADALHLRACAGTHCTVLDWLQSSISMPTCQIQTRLTWCAGSSGPMPITAS